jgi:anti-anti-sigma factor
VALSDRTRQGLAVQDAANDPPAWRCRAEWRSGGGRIVVDGEVDLAVAGILDDAARALEIAPYDVVVADLTGATFIDSSVVAFLLRLHTSARVRAARLVVVAPAGGTVRRTLDLSGASRSLDVTTSE